MILPAIEPGKAIGIVGTGQLGRMIAIAAHKIGYHVWVYGPSAHDEPNPPAAQVADGYIDAAYDNIHALHDFAQRVDIVTYEFENIPSDTIAALEELVPVFPKHQVLHTCQHRQREKTWLNDNIFPVTPFSVIESADELRQQADTLTYPIVLKTVGYGYDGKGQHKCESTIALLTLLDENTLEFPLICEEWVQFDTEASIIIARNAQGDTECYPFIENRHRNHILDMSICPAPLPAELAQQAKHIAEDIASTLDVVGLLAIEFFVTHDEEGQHLLVNELAPRPHNSGHITLDICICNQFEQLIRAICGLPLGHTNPHSAGVMWNVMGELWHQGEPDWKSIFHHPNTRLHLYGKTKPKPGRKMGHINCIAQTTEEALNTLVHIQKQLNATVSSTVQ